MIKQYIHFILVIAISALALSSTPTLAASNGFVSHSGTHFTLNDQPFYVGGTNNHYIAWASSHEIDNVLTDAAAMHFNVVRTFASVIRGSLDGVTQPTIWNWNTSGDPSNMGMEGTYNIYWDTATNQMAWNDGPTGLQKLDYVLAKAKSLNIKILLAFMDFWPYSGGSQQVRNWYGSTDNYTFFFSDPRAKQNYKDWVQHLATHVNIYTGVAYKDDPTIFAWDLMNEPEFSSVQLATSWITEMSAYVKSIDPNHMVTFGSEGFYGGQGGSNPLSNLAISTIDFGTWHTYPVYHNITPTQVVTLIGEHCGTAVQVGKPVLLEEFGYSLTNSDQAAVYQSWTNAINSNPDCAGWLFWRLTSIEDSGSYPRDNGEGFDIHNDNGPTAKVLIAAALAIQHLTAVPTATATFVPPTITPTKPIQLPTLQPTLQPTLILPTNTPVPPTVKPTTIPATPTFVPPTVKSILIAATNTPVPPTVKPAASPTPQTSRFVKGINFGGGNLTVENNRWTDYSFALTQGLTVINGVSGKANISPIPTPASETRAMLNTFIRGSGSTLTIRQTLTNGNYSIYVWDMEVAQSNSRSFAIQVQGVQGPSGLGNLALGQWTKYGPYSAHVTNGLLTINLVSIKGNPMITGMAIFATP